MRGETTTPKQIPQRGLSNFLIVLQTIPSILLLVCTLFGIFIGIRFLSFIERAESRRISLSDKWSESGFEQLQQMHSIIKQELDLILEQRRENQVLQDKIQKLTLSLPVSTKTPVDIPIETPVVVP